MTASCAPWRPLRGAGSRRNLSESQRAMCAARLANLEHGGDRKSEKIKGSNDLLIGQEQAANLFNVSVPSVKRAKAVLARPAGRLGGLAGPRLIKMDRATFPAAPASLATRPAGPAGPRGAGGRAPAALR